jgi:hypothetical protein
VGGKRGEREKKERLYNSVEVRRALVNPDTLCGL